MKKMLREYTTAVLDHYFTLRNNPERKKTSHDWEIACREIQRSCADVYPDIDEFKSAVAKDRLAIKEERRKAKTLSLPTAQEKKPRPLKAPQMTLFPISWAERIRRV